MKRLIAILLLLFPLSCSHYLNVKQDIELKSFIVSFENHCNCKVTIPVLIEKVHSSEEGFKTLGVCYGFRMPKFFRSVRIDTDYWKEANFYKKESTVFHELAHCVLDMEHDERMIGDYIFIRPKSIMYPYSFSQYETYRKEYIRELFNRKASP